MPKPLIKNNDLIKVLDENINLLKKLDNSIIFNINNKTEKILINFDNEQFNRLFFNGLKILLKVFKRKLKNQ